MAGACRIGVCLFVRDAAPAICEWIAFHGLLGVERFFLYDNGSVDGTPQAAGRMSGTHHVEVIDWSLRTSNTAQGEAYTHCLEHYGHLVDWMLFLDCDEFLTAGRNADLRELVRHHADAAAIVFNWTFYGSGHHHAKPAGLVIENFVQRAPNDFAANAHTKMIVRTDAGATYVNPHFFQVNGKVVRANGQIPEWGAPGITRTIVIDGWRVHHYFVGSREHWAEKMRRGYRDITRADEDFSYYDRNDVTDLTAATCAEDVARVLAALDGRG